MNLNVLRNLQKNSGDYKGKNQNDRMKIFITGINTELGYHLVETLRQDDVRLSDYPLISGTLSSQDEFQLHNSIHKSFDFLRERDHAVKCAMQSDVLIVDIRNNPSPQIQFFLKVLKHYNRKTQLKVIGISNFMTWANAKTNEFDRVPHDKDELLDFTLHEGKWKSVSLIKENYPLRQPHPIFVYNYLLEEQIMHLKHHQALIKPQILCIGVLYGLSGIDLGNEIHNAITCTQSEVMKFKFNEHLQEDQKLPFLHVQKLLQTIEKIVHNGQNSSQALKNEYTILCENEPDSVLEIVKNLHQLCGHTEFMGARKQSKDEVQSNVQIPELVLIKNKKLFSFLFNLNFRESSDTKSSQEDQNTTIENDQIENQQPAQKITQKSNKINELALQMINQFRNYHEAPFKHFILTQQLAKESEQLGKEFSLTQTQHKNDQNKEKINKMLLSKYSLLDKERMIKIVQQLIQSGQIPQQKLPASQEEKKKQKPSQKIDKKQSIKKEPYELLFPQIIKKFLKQNQNGNFIIYLQHELVVKMLALFQGEGFQDLKSLKFILFVKKLGIGQNQNMQFMSEKIDTKIEMFSKEFFEITGISETEGSPKNDEILQTSQPVNNLSQHQNRQNINNSLSNEAAESQETKVNLLSQYLLDNVIVYLAEAKQSLKQKGILKTGQKFEGKQNIKLFIQQLKAIHQREEQFFENESDEEKQS